MPRSPAQESNDLGQDSFLDVVTNIVGILIILVMVIGAQVRHVMLKAPTTVPAAVATSVEQLAATVASAEHELSEIECQIAALQASAAAASVGRMQLATALSAAKVERDAWRANADAGKAAAAERSVRLQDLRQEVEAARREAEALAHAEPETKEVLAYPTPIGRTVNGDEIHFQLAAGHVAYIPLEELFGLARQRTQRHSGPIAQIANHIESVGPTQDFSLDYVIEASVDQSRGQVLIRSREWVVRPEHRTVGEPIDVALGSDSAFRRCLGRITPATTVTLWCYPDSFDAFRRVREELHRLGVPTAGRPLPEGAPIGGSSEGSKSVAQ